LGCQDGETDAHLESHDDRVGYCVDHPSQPQYPEHSTATPTKKVSVMAVLTMSVWGAPVPRAATRPTPVSATIVEVVLILNRLAPPSRAWTTIGTKQV
jgi:hypothetical protein